jgi:NAD(P)-dependent dehydrogenase (short-subunit alcohol dehydrogenase family)
MHPARVVIVTGGGKGIGLGIGECFARKGDTVVVADVDLERAQQAAKELHQFGGMACMGIRCNVADRASVKAMADEVDGRFERIDVLVNNAGICPFIDIMEMTPEVWQRTIDVDLSGPFHCTQIVARKMIARGIKGRIIFITSLADTMTGPSQVDYAAAKSGLRMEMAGFAIALAPQGITCNAVAPGHVNTDLTRHWWESPEGKAAIPKTVPLGRLGQPQDIGHACVYLASEEGSYVNGITLRVDGGNSVWNR